MNTKPSSTSKGNESTAGRVSPGFLARGGVGGVLMGLANLVPGISGGTMLLAVGVYPQFISGIAEVSTFRFRTKSLALISCVVIGAMAAIVGLAGPVKGLVVDHRWIMYSLFIGLTLGGVPIIWRLVKPADSAVVISSIVGIILMIGLAVAESKGSTSSSTAEGHHYGLLLLAGIAGGSAMILPGVSGGYLLLVLGQYVTILAAIESAKNGASNSDWAAVGEAMHVFVPVGIGVLVGVVGVSNVIKVLLDKYPKATLGFLLGLLLGAVFGLWPFREPMLPENIVGMSIKGIEMLSVDDVLMVDKGDWPTTMFSPGLVHILGVTALIIAGFIISWGISHFGNSKDDIGGAEQPA